MGPNKLNWNKDSVNKNAQVIPRVPTSNHKSPFFQINDYIKLVKINNIFELFWGLNCF